MNQPTRFLGLDVHKATIAVAFCEGTGAAHSYGTIPNQAAAIRRLTERFDGVEVELKAELHRVAEQSPQLPLIAALQAMRGLPS